MNLWSQQENGRGGGASVKSPGNLRLSAANAEGSWWLSVSAGGGDVDEVVVDSIAFPSPSARGGIGSPNPFSLSLGRSEAVTVFSGSEAVSIQSAGQSYWVRKALRLAIGHGMRVLQERRSERKRRQCQCTG